MLLSVLLLVVAIVCLIFSYRIISSTIKMMDGFINEMTIETKNLEAYHDDLLHGDWAGK